MEKNLLIPYKQLFLFVLGGSLYYMIEILYRGYSHWTMFMAGGIIFLFAGFFRLSILERDTPCLAFRPVY